VTRSEADVARGKISLLNGLSERMFDDPAGVSERLNRCLLCGACEAVCPRGIKLTEIYVSARSILAEYMGLSFAKKIMFRNLLARPRRFDIMAPWAARFQGLVTRPSVSPASPVARRMVSPLLMDRWVPALPKTPFHMIDMPSPRANISGPRVALFVGCLIDKVFPEIAIAMIDSLQYHGIDVSVPAGQGCCGIPALASGDRQTFHFLAAWNLKCFDPDDFDWLITGCATCTAVIKNIWPDICGPEIGLKERARLRRLADKTMDFSQLLARMPDLEPRIPGSSLPLVTYHDPCHLKNSLGVTEAPRKILAASACRFTEMEDAGTCCGMGGGFGLSFPEISRSLGEEKKKRIIASGADVVATSCPACMIQLAGISMSASHPFAVRHVAEVYADKIRQRSDGK